MRKILFIGMPGSGKGSQAQLLVPLGFVHIATGDILRDAWKKQDPLLMPYKDSVDKGEYLPDEIIFKMLEKATKNIKGKGYILDGAVRTLNQAKVALKKNLFDEVVYFEVAQDVIIKRLGNRTVCPKCDKIFVGNPGKCDKCGIEVIVREDDKPEAIKKRLKIYKEKTEPLIKFLKSKVKFYTVDGTPPIPEVDKSVLKVLGLKKE